MHRALSLLLPLALAACGDKADDSGGDTAAPVDNSFEAISADILQPSCGFSSCHGAGAGGLQLDADTTPDDLVGVASTAKAGAVLVVAGDSAGSYLIQKMRDDPDIEGTVMPQGGMLDEATIQRVEAWIDAGATD